MAVDPKTVLDKMKRNSHLEAKRKVETLEKLKEREEFEKLEELHKKSLDPVKRKNISGAIKGEVDIYSHAKDIASEAEEEVIVCMPAKNILNKSRTFKKIFKKLGEEGIDLRILASGKGEEVEKIEREFKINPTHTDLETKFVLVDREQILFSLNDPKDEEEVAVWLNSGFFSKAFADLLETKIDK